MCKIFVGNVPFDCDECEFVECFKNMAGFVRAEIIYKNNTLVPKMSRGFGFVTFETPEHAKMLLDNKCVMFKDRKLRFTQYVSNIGNNMSFSLYDKQNCITNKYVFNDKNIKDKNFIVVKNLSETITRKELHDIFAKFSTIGKHFIVTDRDTGTLKSYAIIEILNDAIYNLLLEQKEIKYGSFVFEIGKWRLKSTNVEKKYVINKK